MIIFVEYFVIAFFSGGHPPVHRQAVGAGQLYLRRYTLPDDPEGRIKNLRFSMFYVFYNCLQKRSYFSDFLWTVDRAPFLDTSMNSWCFLCPP